jgi:hypothetical protein
MSERTVFLSRLIGLYCILVAMSMMLHKQSVVEAVTALLNDPPLVLLVGVLTLVAGLAMVLTHNIWSAGPSALLVTIVGWITLMKGLLFLSLPREREADLLLAKLHYTEYFYLFMAISLMIGLYLTYKGFRFRVKGRAD